MTWEGLLSDIAGLTGIPGAAQSYVRGVVITQAVRAGASANSIIRSLSSAGIGVRRQQALQLISAEQSRQAAGATSTQLDLTQPTDVLLAAEPPPGFTGQYIHQVSYTWRTRDAEGNYLLHTRTMAIKSPTILTGLDAMNATQDILSQSDLGPGDNTWVDPNSIIGMSLSGVWYDTQNRNIRGVTQAGG